MNNNNQQLLFTYYDNNPTLSAAGTSHAAAVNGNGEIFLWGNNKDAQVCPKKIALLPKPMKVTGLNSVSIKQVILMRVLQIFNSYLVLGIFLSYFIIAFIFRLTNFISNKRQ